MLETQTFTDILQGSSPGLDPNLLEPNRFFKVVGFGQGDDSFVQLPRKRTARQLTALGRGRDVAGNFSLNETLAYSLSPTDQYGFLGFDQALFTNVQMREKLRHSILGPEVEDTVQQEPYSALWTAFISQDDGGVYYRKEGQPANEAVDMFTKPVSFNQLSWVFDASASRVMMSGDGSTIKVFVGVDIFSFAGLSGTMFYNGDLQPDEDLLDAVCLYTKGTTDLFARFQRDQFGIEYTLATLQQPITDVYNAFVGQDFRAYVLVGNVFGARCATMLRSRQYPPVLPRAGMIASGQPVGGTYDLIILNAGSVGAEQTLMNGSPVSGSYEEVVINSVVSGESQSINGAPVGGSYDAVVINGGLSSDDSIVSGSPVGGSYDEIAIEQGKIGEDTNNVKGEPVGGNYAIP